MRSQGYLTSHVSVKNAGLTEIRETMAVPSESMGIKTAEMKL